MVVNHYEKLLSKNGCNIEEIPPEWDPVKVKAYLEPILKSQTKIDYLEVWKSIFTNDNVKRECKNVLHVIELLLITPFTNANLERVFSRMNRIKTESRNRLGQERLDTQIRVVEEGVNIVEFNPDPYIEKWYANKVRRINRAKPRNYPSKRRSVDFSTSSGHTVMDIASITLSDLESSDEEFEEF